MKKKNTNNKCLISRKSMIFKVVYPSTKDRYKQYLLYNHDLCILWQSKLNLEKILLKFRKLYLPQEIFDAETAFLQEMEKLCKELTEYYKGHLLMVDYLEVYTETMVQEQIKKYDLINKCLKILPEYWWFANIYNILFVLLIVAIVIL